jgi:hypothetical protein
MKSLLTVGVTVTPTATSTVAVGDGATATITAIFIAGNSLNGAASRTVTR